MVQAALLAAAVVVALFAAIPWIRYEHWWIRMFDFPRLQVLWLAVIVVIAWLVWGDPGALRLVGVALAAGAAIVQAVTILPYTRLWPKEAVGALGGRPTLRLLIANVKMDNRDSAGLLAFIERQQPDLVVLDEPDDWWEQQLRPLESSHSHVLKEPLSNTYGMLLYSAFPFVHAERRNVLDDEIPSFHVCIDVRGTQVTLHLMHPAPPYPEFAKSTLGRDAELLVVGRLARRERGPVIVAGDLNDVAWSRTTRLFQRISGLLDPRRGRGMYNTFHASYPWMRWPLDHLFHSRHFRLARIERGPDVGSDHFPMLVELEIDPDARDEQDAPRADRGDEQDVSEKVAGACDEKAEQ